MKLVALTDAQMHPLPYYLAVEEWVARYMPQDDYMFAWQADSSVICGRHQLMELEVDMNFCRERGIEVWRRRSGGGAVYADKNNIMFSYITNRQGNKGCFEFYTHSMCTMLAELGINAAPTGRNDIEIAGKKVAGNAFYGLKGRSIVHGTMLYDSDSETMSRALTPSRAKLSSKGVKSVPKRVTTLREQGLTMSIDEFKSYALRTLCKGGIISPTAEDEHVINEIMKGYLDPAFRFDKPIKENNSIRVEGCGELLFSCELDSDNRIHDANLRGDFFATDELKGLLELLNGVKFNRECIKESLKDIDVSSIIAGLDTEMFTNIILKLNLQTL